MIGIFKNVRGVSGSFPPLGLPLWPTGNIKVVPSFVNLFKVLTVVNAIDVSLLLGAVTLWIPGAEIKK